MTYKTYSFRGEDYKYFGCPHAKEQVGDAGCCKRYITEDNLILAEKLSRLQREKEKCESDRFANVDQFMAGQLDKFIGI